MKRLQNCALLAAMKLAIIGLGKMGGNIARRLSRAGIELVLLDQDPTVTQKVARETGGDGQEL